MGEQKDFFFLDLNRFYVTLFGSVSELMCILCLGSMFTTCFHPLLGSNDFFLYQCYF